MSEKTLPRLPVANAEFELLRENGGLYVDKTDLIYALIELDEPVFLSRPRRFGKTTLVSTLHSLFSSGLKYFEGLKIASLWTENRTYPVLRLDFTALRAQSSDFERELVAYVYRCCDRLCVPYVKPPAVNISQCVNSIADAASRRSLVLLIDEYDHPLIEHLHQSEEFEAVVKVLRAFYGAIKANAAQFRFIFITGVARFAHTSIFSGFNTLNDISLKAEYGAILGFTEEELYVYFEPYLKRLASRISMDVPAVKEQLRLHYDGYVFDFALSKHVYNPWSVLKTFKERDAVEPFAPWWIQSGAFSVFLINWLKDKTAACHSYLALMNSLSGESDPLNEVESVDKQRFFLPEELGSISAPVLLYLTGYLTLVAIRGETVFLGYPNLEVRDFLRKSLFLDVIQPVLRQRFKAAGQNLSAISDILIEGDNARVSELLNQCLALFPYDERRVLTTEKGLCALLSMALRSVGFEQVSAEENFLWGRTDLKLNFENWQGKPQTVIFEVKLCDANQVTEALIAAREQMKEKHYAYNASLGNTVFSYAVAAVRPDFVLQAVFIGEQRTSGHGA